MLRLPESPRRWIEFPLWFLFIALCLAPLPGFLHALRSNTLAKNAGLLEVVFGLLGLLLLWRVGRRGVLCLRAGRSVVEVSPQPAKAGADLDYRLSLGRDATATLTCIQSGFRRRTIVLASLPLAPAVAEGNRWTIAGKAPLPPDWATSPRGAIPTIAWRIDVRLTFPNGAVLEESHPLRVDP